MTFYAKKLCAVRHSLAMWNCLIILFLLLSEITSHLKQLYLARVLISQVDDSLCEQGQLKLIQQNSHQYLSTLSTNTINVNNNVAISEALSLIESDHPANRKQPCTILIQGTYGSGKTALLKEISFQWASGTLLKNCDVLFLLHLRDLLVHEMDSLFDFLYYFFEHDTNYKEIVSEFEVELLQDGGQSVTLLLDSYHDYPHSLQQNGFIAKILKRKVLPACTIILTSRTAKLKFEVTYQFKMKGLTKKYSIEQCQHEAAVLYKYLQNYQDIPNPCYYIPLYMNMLLVMYKEGIFLTKFTDLYSQFICLTINRYLRKRGTKGMIKNITELELKQPFSNIITQLSKLAFTGLKRNQTIFNEVELTGECPDLIKVDSKTWGGLGILRTMSHVDPEQINTFQFFHYSMQEFLAAYHLSKLPSDEMIELLQKEFWNQKYHRMFIFYVGLTKEHNSCFKKFLCDGNDEFTIPEEYLSDQSKCSYLYQCFKEVGNEKACNDIEST